MTKTLKIGSHDELISYVPHALRFSPENSMVCLAFGGGPTTRVDLPESPGSMGSFVDQLADVYLNRHPTRRLALIAFGEDGRTCLEALSALGERMVNDQRGPDVGPMLWVNGDEWFEVLEGTSGRIDPAARDRMAAEFALMGHDMPTGRRQDLATAMRGDPTPVADLLPAAEEREAALDLRSRTAEVAWVGSRIDEFLDERRPLSDTDAARVLAVIHDSGTRNAAEIRMTRANAAVSSEFWHDLVRRAPDEVRDTPAALLALSSYLEGDGAKAWTALDQITEARPPVADLVATALEQVIDPADFERALRQTDTSTVMQHAALSDPASHEPHAHQPDRQPTSGRGDRATSAPVR